MKIAVVAVLAGVLGGSACAQAPAGRAMPGLGHGAMPSGPGVGPSANHGAMMRSMEEMTAAMTGVPMTGDPDRDLVAMMIPHHQGAIDMARIYLRDGRDPEIRQMAETIIKDQEREIAAFKAWQGKHKPMVR